MPSAPWTLPRFRSICCAAALALPVSLAACEKEGASDPEPAATEGGAADAGADDGAEAPKGETLKDVHLCCETRAGIDGQTLALSGCAKVPVEEATTCTDGGKFYIDCDEATCDDTSCHCNEHHDDAETADPPADAAAEEPAAVAPAE